MLFHVAAQFQRLNATVGVCSVFGLRDSAELPFRRQEGGTDCLYNIWSPAALPSKPAVRPASALRPSATFYGGFRAFDVVH
jgi:hypothetical protein